jgi:hypothetical protein
VITLFCIQPKGFNVGNEVIHYALRHVLSEAFGRVVNVIALPATGRWETHGRAGLTASTIHEINQYADGVIVGGGNLYENGELDVNPDALETLQVPMLLFSLSRGRIYDRRRRLVRRTDAMPDRIITALHRKAAYSLARDETTLAYLHALGCDHAQLGGCPTIDLGGWANELPATPPPDQSGVLISVRNPSLMNVPLELQAQVPGHVARIIEHLRDLDLGDVRLLCHDHRDIPFAASIPGIDYIYTGDVRTYLSLLRSCRLSVSYRLHATLPCISFGRPGIKISYDERAMSTMRTLGLGEWNIDMVREDDVVGQVIDRCERLGELARITDAARPVWASLRQTTRAVMGAFAQEVTAHCTGVREEARV